jgi:hypothetical protein
MGIGSLQIFKLSWFYTTLDPNPKTYMKGEIWEFGSSSRGAQLQVYLW